MVTRDESRRPPWDRSGFWPMVGNLVMLSAAIVREPTIWRESVALMLVQVGMFLGATVRNKTTGGVK